MQQVESSPIENSEITQLLQHWSEGDQEAGDRVISLVYCDLHRIAESFARRERPDHTLQATALVHEAYLQLIGTRSIEWQSRAHFLSVAARVMRHILVSYSRKVQAVKRGGDRYKITLSERELTPASSRFGLELAPIRPQHLVALDDAIKSLARIDPDAAQLVELRFFAGLSLEGTAECLGVSCKTVTRRWRQARAWLLAELSNGGGARDHRASTQPRVH